MVAVTPQSSTRAVAAGSPGWSRRIVLAVAAAYFLIPLAIALSFTVYNEAQGFSLGAYGRIVTSPGFATSFLTSLALGAVTIVLVLVLLLPAMIAVRLGAPGLRPVLETITTLPLIVPPITYVVGISTALRDGADALAATPFWATIIAIQDDRFPVVLVLAYVILALPFAYRALDAGFRAIDVVTLVEAARNLGASWPHLMLRVIMPNLRSALGGAAFLTLALVLGEYTIAALLGYQTFPVWIVTISGNDGQLSVALSILSLTLIWLLLLTLSRAGRKKS